MRGTTSMNWNLDGKSHSKNFLNIKNMTGREV